VSSIKIFFHENTIKINLHELEYILGYITFFFNKLTAYEGHTIDVLKWKVGSKKNEGAN